MRPGGSKEKGSEFERKVGRDLSLWLSRGRRSDLFRRTVLSGGQWTAAAQRQTQRGEPGDLGANHPAAFEFLDKFVIECKHWKSIDLIDVIWRGHDLYKAMVKVQKEADSVGRNWMLIARQNLRPTLLFFPVPTEYDYEPPCSWHKLFNGTVYLVKFEDFLKEADPEGFLCQFPKEAHGQ